MRERGRGRIPRVKDTRVRREYDGGRVKRAGGGGGRRRRDVEKDGRARIDPDRLYVSHRDGV